MPKGCLAESDSISMSSLHDTMKVICNNDQCQESGYMHRACFDHWEDLILKYLAGLGRARSWSDKQRHQNIWNKKGYDLAFKACGCRCEKGHLRKDTDWCPPSPPKADQEAAKKKRRPRKNSKTLPTLTISTSVAKNSPAAKHQLVRKNSLEPSSAGSDTVTMSPTVYHTMSNAMASVAIVDNGNCRNQAKQDQTINNFFQNSNYSNSNHQPTTMTGNINHNISQSNHQTSCPTTSKTTLMSLGRSRTASMSSTGSATSGGGGTSPPMFYNSASDGSASPDIQNTSIRKLFGFGGSLDSPPPPTISSNSHMVMTSSHQVMSGPPPTSPPFPSPMMAVSKPAPLRPLVLEPTILPSMASIKDRFNYSPPPQSQAPMKHLEQQLSPSVSPPLSSSSSSSSTVRERHNSGSIFSRRADYSTFNVLPKTKINSYHIKVEDDPVGDETRNFLLAALSVSKCDR